MLPSNITEISNFADIALAALFISVTYIIRVSTPVKVIRVATQPIPNTLVQNSKWIWIFSVMQKICNSVRQYHMFGSQTPMTISVFQPVGFPRPATVWLTGVYVCPEKPRFMRRNVWKGFTLLGSHELKSYFTVSCGEVSSGR